MTRFRKLLGLDPPLRRVDLAEMPRRVMLYCASDVGLGHFSRMNRIGDRLRHYLPDANILFVTDILPAPSPEFNDRFGVLKLPGYIHSEEHSDRPSGLNLPLQALVRLRANIIMTALEGFRPHLLLMDTGPHGKRNELQRPLEWLAKAHPQTWRMMQMRDIPIPPDEYHAPGASYHRKMLAEHWLYDLFLVSGHPRLFDVAKEYGWQGELADKVTYCGLVVPPPEAINPAPKDAGVCRVIVSFGGGWQAGDLVPMVMRVYERLAAAHPRVELRLFTGPALGRGELDQLRRDTAKWPDFHAVQFSPEFPGLLQSADLAILQAGSTPYQILESDIPMILYTRDYTTQEQQVRAQLLSRFTGVRVIDREWTEHNELADLAAEMLAAPRTQRNTRYAYDGVDRAARILSRILKENPPQGEGLRRLVEDEVQK